MTNSAQERIAAMENTLLSHMAANGRPFAHTSVHVMATSRGWVVFVDSNRVVDGVEALDTALEAAEAYTRKVVSADDNLARTLGIAS